MVKNAWHNNVASEETHSWNVLVGQIMKFPGKIREYEL